MLWNRASEEEFALLHDTMLNMVADYVGQLHTATE